MGRGEGGTALLKIMDINRELLLLKQSRNYYTKLASLRKFENLSVSKRQVVKLSLMYNLIF